MPSQYPYRRTVRNDYLGISKVIRAMTPSELQWLADAQLAKWGEKERRKRQQRQKESERQTALQQVENLKLRAEEETKIAQQNLEAFRSILAGGLRAKPAFDWEEFIDRRQFRTI